MLRWPARLLEKIVHLANSVSIADFPPTDQAVEVQKLLEGRIQTRQGELAGLLSREVAVLNRALLARNIEPIMTKLP